ncbi:hypothetical protein H6G00_17865 [Leptolyngbya sp. FACHB-541]|uniref:hypothetical protein n=1 Tax=Leptolyngbya sp. FACHB-541 TaxID=2692810 RepID=UPI0016890ED7|nr:hypothetical protein [Leptolyngbya sp. FACHB-541]MBD1998472.1 hypothetical protein [Leptolyngbya sp. FACHB-541]
MSDYEALPPVHEAEPHGRNSQAELGNEVKQFQRSPTLIPVPDAVLGTVNIFYSFRRSKQVGINHEH